MKSFKLSSLFLGMVLPLAGLAGQVPYSPYADLTINTHWDSQTQSMQPMALDKIAADNHIKSYHLAFIVDKGQCNPAWAGQYTLNDKFADYLTAKLRAQGASTIISFGGASGMDLSKACSQQSLVSAFKQISTRYQAKGLDFDIENGSANVPKLIKAIATFQKSNPNITISFTLPTMPEGLTAEGKSVITKARDAGINFNVNIMAMDFGPAYQGDMGEYTIQAAKALYATLQSLYPSSSQASLWKRIEVTPMIGINDVSVEHFTLENAQRLKSWADGVGLGGLSIWSIARDKPCDSQWASPICSGQGQQGVDYEFSQSFAQ